MFLCSLTNIHGCLTQENKEWLRTKVVFIYKIIKLLNSRQKLNNMGFPDTYSVIVYIEMLLCGEFGWP